MWIASFETYKTIQCNTSAYFYLFLSFYRYTHTHTYLLASYIHTYIHMCVCWRSSFEFITYTMTMNYSTFLWTSYVVCLLHDFLLLYLRFFTFLFIFFSFFLFLFLSLVFCHFFSFCYFFVFCVRWFPSCVFICLWFIVTKITRRNKCMRER